MKCHLKEVCLLLFINVIIFFLIFASTGGIKSSLVLGIISVFLLTIFMVGGFTWCEYCDKLTQRRDGITQGEDWFYCNKCINLGFIVKRDDGFYLERNEMEKQKKKIPKGHIVKNKHGWCVKNT